MPGNQGVEGELGVFIYSRSLVSYDLYSVCEFFSGRADAFICLDTASMLIMVLAHVQASGDRSLVQQYVSLLLFSRLLCCRS